ncbi:MAG TPA: NFACT family protein [Pyrinomonadaceae bacterium]|jgi:predicted ribosome quality control (RQC) complex YloA/Tae2 family protein
MDDQTISDIVEEIAPILKGHSPGKIFQLSAFALAIDFHSRDKNYLFISADPNQPGLYMMARRVNELEKQSSGLSPFAQALKSELSPTRIQSVKKDSDDRIVRFSFAGRNDVGQEVARTLVAQLTGRAANLFLLDAQDMILRALRPGRGEGQAVGQKYKSPAHSSAEVSQRQSEPLKQGAFKTLSEAADAHYRRLAETRALAGKVSTARTNLRKQTSQRQRLVRQLERDLSAQSTAAEHKRIGDLLLANLSTAKRRGAVVQLIDYFAEGAPKIEIEVDEGSNLQEEAARRFARYTKSKRATQEITKRLKAVKSELEKLRARQTMLEQIISAGDEAALEAFTGLSVSPAPGGRFSKEKPDKKIPGVRRYLSADGYEILVGRAARDNDHLTFKVAKPYDLWLHAADYPGSHVIVRNPTRKDIPHGTIIAAAQLAAHFCQARKDSKVDVHYALRKFLSKPKGAAPGLVRMSSFKTITVSPAESAQRL